MNGLLFQSIRLSGPQNFSPGRMKGELVVAGCLVSGHLSVISARREPSGGECFERMGIQRITPEASFYSTVRAKFCAGVLAVVALGLGSRRFGAHLPTFIAEYAGDTLWALMVFLSLGLIAPRSSVWWRAAVALVISYTVELSQLYQAPWIEALRRTTLGGLVLGFGFLWSDLVCYSVGVGTGVLLELVAYRYTRAKTQTPHKLSR
jgi:hypothetical protein